jgi:hypothetical protein
MVAREITCVRAQTSALNILQSTEPRSGKASVIGQEAGKSFAYILGVYLGDGAVTVWRQTGKSDRLMFRLNTIDEDFALAVKSALADLSSYKVVLSCHIARKQRRVDEWAATVPDPRGLRFRAKPTPETTCQAPHNGVKT